MKVTLDGTEFDVSDTFKTITLPEGFWDDVKQIFEGDTGGVCTTAGPGQGVETASTLGKFLFRTVIAAAKKHVEKRDR